MFTKLRVKLARWLIGSDPAILMLVHGYGMAKFMAVMGASKVGYVTSDGTFYQIEKKTEGEEEETLQLCCDVCTNVFAAKPDRPAKCPSCGSAHISLADGPIEG